MAPALLCLLPLLLLSSLPGALSAAPCNAADKSALLQFKKDLGDPYTIITWTAATDCCSDWYAMGCDSDTGRVTSIDISSSEARGPLPPSVGDLPYLNTLTVRKSPNLTGPIPPELSKLTNLKMLWMDWNSLTGPIPAFLGRLTKLDYINLSFNKLTGSIPPSLGDLPLLRGLFLDRNQLTGTIPEELGRLPSPSLFIRLGHNNLTGPIPQSFKNLQINSIDLSRNQLTGDPSVLFVTGDWASDITLFLYLDRNQFEFDLSKAKFSPTLSWLDLNHNRVYGSIPAQVTKLPLQNFNVSYNRLCGEIPQGGRLAELTEYEFFHNKCLCGKPLQPCK
uniref:Polygalacturonase inhibitor n=1 Tax=Anthurium amnicola TaxID=1678845 RepID=A0A1D1XPX9_9ARAE